MQAIMETLFDAAYLIGVVAVGLVMVKNAGGNKQTRLFGWMAVLLGCGDAFHLIPRAYALWTTGLEANAAALGLGKWITSITMTVFYMVLYYIWRERYEIQGKRGLTVTMYVLTALRMILCFFPQNQWFVYNPPVIWGIYRNIPFAIMGLLMIVIFYQEASKRKDQAFRYMWLAITLSFALYVPVVLWSATMPMVGILMIPKTLAYVWIVAMGYGEYKKNRKLA